MMFLLFQDLNVFFEYIVYFIKYKVQITTHIPAGISQGFNGLLATNNAAGFLKLMAEL